MFDKFLEALDDDPFEEYPVGVKEFVEGEKFLNHPPLSDIQYNAVECMSQIYYQKDLERFMTGTEAYDHYKKYTKTEVILQLGKGCHGADNPVYSPEIGTWIPIAEHAGMVESDGAKYATEAFIEGKDQLYEVTFGNNMKEVVSGDHKYLAAHRPNIKDIDDYEFIQVNQLKPNDRVAWNRNYTVVDPVNIPLEHAEILSMCANKYEVDDEGRVHFKVHYFHSNLKDKLVADFQATTTYETATVTDVMVDDQHFLSILDQYGMLVGHNDKRIPKQVFKSDNDTLTYFLKKSFEYVGNVGIRSSGRHGYQLRQMPPGYGEDIAHAVMRIGVLPSILVLEDIFMYGPSRIRYNVFVDAFPMNKLMADVLGEEHVWQNANNYEVRKGPIITDDYFLVPIKTIKPLEYGEYWTKTVPDTGWYVGNGPVSSNSGKDLLSTIAVSYVVYKLLCLKDPARYYGKPSGDAIDIINIAINAQQARNVFFKGLKNKISQSPWFAGKYNDTQESIAFIKSVTAYSGHSERESHEGLNLIMAVLDEISGFGEASALNEQGKSAQNIYDAFRASVDSRFPDGIGCVALLSFPRHREDFITTKYNEAIAQKDVVVRKHQYIINEELPPSEDNTFEIEWEEDHIKTYVLPDIWAIRRPSWDVNPTRHIDNYKNAFFRNKIDALQRFACMPSDISKDSFFRSIDKIETAMAIRNPVDRTRRIEESWKPDPNVTYYVHADLAQKQDKCAVAVAHVEKWTNIEGPHGYKETVPFVVVDMLAWWEPKVEGPVDLSEVKRWIINLRSRGLNIGYVSFDRWGSFDLIRELKDRGFNSDTLSVAKKHYEDFAMMLYEERVLIPKDDTLYDEMLALKVIKNKVDHPRKSSKDLSDAVTGAIYNAISKTPRNVNQVVEVHTWAPSKQDRDEQREPEYTSEERNEAATWLRGLGVL